MTADSYASAADLVARSAAAYVSGVPEAPTDDGFFGPDSVTWRVSADLSAPVAGLRSLLMQALHPLAMAGVDQHSAWRQDPVGRLAATSAYLSIIRFGERAAAEQAAARVQRIHEHVRGVDPVTGRPYAASDPALLLWVHATLVESGIAAARLFGTPLSEQDSDRYTDEMVVAAELVGVPRALVPTTLSELERYISSVQPELICTPAAQESMTYLLDLPGLAEDIAAIWQDVRDGAIAALPAWAREMYGYEAPRSMGTSRRTEIQQALGVLDAVFLGEPGVLEARQRIVLRTRAARRG
ncbi:MAG TPA: oxygenase MpaB family protein [Streptosporangiaceae bacterium]